MRADNWFISNLDDGQRAIVVSDINKNIIVQGAAGSGKTNLAIHRAKQASLFSDNYGIVIYTRALMRMVATGMRALGLNDERIVYDWAWNNSGFQLNGNVFYMESNPDELYLVDGESVRKFIRVMGCASLSSVEEKYPGTTVVGLDFGDWVSNEHYCRYGRRTSKFREVQCQDVNLEECKPLTSAVLYRRAPESIDYLIVDEVQDFSKDELQSNYFSKVNRTYAVFGDSAQMIYKGRGSSMDNLRLGLKADPYFLEFNYRLPKSIARVAQEIAEPSIDLISKNMKDRGNSDYPNYPKPVVTKYKDRAEELQGILDKIREADLDDVAILVPTDDDLKQVYNFLKDNGIDSQVLFRTSRTVPFRTINTLDMANTDMPCILTYHAAKGTEFDNVFVPFANFGTLTDRKAFYVACTRSSHSLFISHTGRRTEFMSKVKKDDIVEIDATSSTNDPF